ncbi:hypothetical protein [Thalassovita sp.]|uniref:hypothetical protein n=1 Tax=Thalassovita sp. TaxID=1979401 RepID=UPI002B272BFF|nr:hypothetical protein [Thalassovita sp.]
MIWPFKRKSDDMEQRSMGVTLAYMEHRRRGLLTDGAVPLSATVGTALHYWTSGFAMLDLAPVPVDPATLAAMGRDLLLRGQTCWHIRADGSDLRLDHVAYWDELAGGKFHLHIAHPNSTETRKALADEVLKLTINADPATPWQGRSPWAMMGLSPALMAEIERAVSNATAYTGKGLLPMPSTIPEEQQAKAATGLQSSSLAVVSSKADFAHQTGGHTSEFRRVDLTPDLQKADLNGFTTDLHHRLLTGCGIPPALVTGNGNAGAMREGYRLFALQTILPLARQCLPELTRKIGVQTVSIDQMMSADVAGRARAVGVLTGAGVPLDKAMKLAGWSDE